MVSLPLRLSILISSVSKGKLCYRQALLTSVMRPAYPVEVYRQNNFANQQQLYDFLAHGIHLFYTLFPGLSLGPCQGLILQDLPQLSHYPLKGYLKLRGNGVEGIQVVMPRKVRGAQRIVDGCDLVVLPPSHATVGPCVEDGVLRDTDQILQL